MENLISLRLRVGYCSGTKGDGVPLSPCPVFTTELKLILRFYVEFQKTECSSKGNQRVEEVIMTLEKICAVPKIITVS